MIANFDSCDISCIHEEAVAEARENMLGDQEARSLAELFKTLSDPKRVKLLFALMSKELCVCDLAAVIYASESSVSQHLRILRTQKLVKNRRDGKALYYSLADDHVTTLFKQGLEHASHTENWGLKSMALSNDNHNAS